MRRITTGLVLALALACAAPANAVPLRTMPGLEFFNFWEWTNGTEAQSMSLPRFAAQLVERRPGELAPPDTDLFPVAGYEGYDLFYSGPDGTFDPDGEYLTFEARSPLIPGFQGGSGPLNIAQVDVYFADGTNRHLDYVASYRELGASAGGFTAGHAVDGLLTSWTFMGDTFGTSERLRLTLGFTPAQAPPPPPPPSAPPPPPPSGAPNAPLGIVPPPAAQFVVPDEDAPQVHVTSPDYGQTVKEGDQLVARYSCTPAGVTCTGNFDDGDRTGNVPDGGLLPTSKVDTLWLEVTARNAAGRTATQRRGYIVQPRLFTVGALTSLVDKLGEEVGSGFANTLDRNGAPARIAAPRHEFEDRAGNVVAVGGGNIVAAGGGNIIAAGGGNVVAVGGGNIVAVGGGNIVALPGGEYEIRDAGNNTIAKGVGDVIRKGQIIAIGGGNVIAVGAGNVIAVGAGNAVTPRTLAMIGPSRIVAVGGGNLANIKTEFLGPGFAGRIVTSLEAVVRSDTFTGARLAQRRTRRVQLARGAATMRAAGGNVLKIRFTSAGKRLIARVARQNRKRSGGRKQALQLVMRTRARPARGETVEIIRRMTTRPGTEQFAP